MVKEKARGAGRQALRRIPELPAAEHSAEDASCQLTSVLSDAEQNSEHHPSLSNQELADSTDDVKCSKFVWYDSKM